MALNECALACFAAEREKKVAKNGASRFSIDRGREKERKKDGGYISPAFGVNDGCSNSRQTHSAFSVSLRWPLDE